APFTMGVGIYAFYAMQPYLLQLYGNQRAFGIAGLAAATVAGCEMLGGVLAPHARKLFRRRTQALFLAAALGAVALAGIGWTSRFWLAVALLWAWQLVDSAGRPMRQIYLNGVIPSAQRATVLSFDNLMGSAGGVVVQPALGRVADAAGYGTAYLVGAVIQLGALPFLLLARRENAPSDAIED